MNKIPEFTWQLNISRVIITLKGDGLPCMMLAGGKVHSGTLIQGASSGETNNKANHLFISNY